jgi:penicillin-binding protein 1B
LEGAKAAAPIWTEFMLRASKLPRYHDMQPFTPPAGVIPVQIDKLTNMPANQSCPDDYQVFFIDGTVPAATCDHPEGPSRNFFQKLLGIGLHRELVLPPVTQPSTGNNPPPIIPNQPPPGSTTAPAQPEVKEKKKSFWRRLFGGGKKDQDKTTQGTDTNQ